MVNKFLTWLDCKDYTVSEELCRQGFITPRELVLEQEYNRVKVKSYWIWTYKLFVVPIVWTMKKSNRFACLVHRVARRVWIDKALKTVREKLNEL